MSGPTPEDGPLSRVRPILRAASAYHAPTAPPPIKLDANESPWPLPEATQRRVAAAMARAPLHRYPDGTAARLRTALAAREDADPDSLVLGVGSDEVIGILLTAFDRPRAGQDHATVVYPTPSFVMYPITARVHGVVPHGVPLGDGFALDVPAMRAAMRAHAPNLVFVASPNNPTGSAFADADLEALVLAAAPDTLLVLDEAYAPFSGRSLASWVDRYEHVGAMGTLSKVGLAGLRVGWARLPAALAHEANKARPPYNLCAPSQAAALYLLEEEPEVLDHAIASIVAERERLLGRLRALPHLEVHPSDANFALIEVEDAAAAHAALLARGVAVRRFASEPRLARALRLTVGTPDENDALLTALAAL